MIIGIITFTDGEKKPEIFKDQDHVLAWKESARINNIGQPSHIRIEKLETSKPIDPSYHCFFVPQFQNYIVSKN